MGRPHVVLAHGVVWAPVAMNTSCCQIIWRNQSYEIHNPARAVCNLQA